MCMCLCVVRSAYICLTGVCMCRYICVFLCIGWFDYCGECHLSKLDQINKNILFCTNAQFVIYYKH